MILVTGVAGALGGQIFRRLAEDSTLDLVAGTRSPSEWTGDAPVRAIDFDQPEALVDGFSGADVLVFVSAGYAEDDVVLARHGATIEAAAKAGVRHVIYTSLAGSGDQLTIALAHRWTEGRLVEAGFGTTILRNGLYAEVPAGLAAMTAPAAAASGILRAPLGGGAMSVVAREDLADVSATVAAEVHASVVAGLHSPHAGQVYELEGTASVGGTEVAAALTEALGTPISYEPSPLGEMWAALSAAGLPPYQVAHTMSTLSNLNAGLLTARKSDLPALLGTAPRPALEVITETVRAALETRIVDA